MGERRKGETQIQIFTDYAHSNHFMLTFKRIKCSTCADNMEFYISFSKLITILITIYWTEKKNQRTESLTVLLIFQVNVVLYMVLHTWLNMQKALIQLS